MKELDYIEGLAKYLVKRDEHLALNMEQANQLVKYIRLYENKCGMLPPPESSKLPRIKQLIDEASYAMVSLDRFKWEDEDGE